MKTSIPNPREIIARKIRTAMPLPQDIIDAMKELSLPLQLAFFRRYCKITQGELAAVLGIKQAYVSRLEEEPSNHLLSHYAKVAKELGSRIVVLPGRTRVILSPSLKTIQEKQKTA